VRLRTAAAVRLVIGAWIGVWVRLPARMLERGPDAGDLDQTKISRIYLKDILHEFDLF
jgi:hypothetical protein